MERNTLLPRSVLLSLTAVCILAAAAIPNAARGGDGGAQASDGQPVDVLIDMRHAHDFSDFPLSVDDRFYHRIYSFHSAFEYLKSQGVTVDKYESEEPITEARLAQCRAVFLNLPSGDKSPFLLSELVAFKNFVWNGGSIFFIVDHTNCYFHQSRLEPLFHELEIAPQFYGICDATQNLGSGTGWIYINSFSPHPITKNLRQIAFQTGGGVDPRYAVAWSSEKSWRDKAGMPLYGEADLSYFGNFMRDMDEPVGRCGAVLAKTYGKGKIVAVGDQNLFSAFFLQYLDVYRLWGGAFAWLLDRPELAEPKRYVDSTDKTRLVVCWEELRRGAPRFGNPDADGYYRLYSRLCRYYNLFCVANDDSAIGLESDVALMLEAGPDESNEGIEFAYRQLKRGKTLVVVDPQPDALENKETAVAKVVKRLAENGITLKNGEKNASASKENAAAKTKRFRKIARFSNDAKLALVHGRESFDNSALPAPEERFLLSHQENLRSLTAEIDAALPAKPGDEN